MSKLFVPSNFFTLNFVFETMDLVVNEVDAAFTGIKKLEDESLDIFSIQRLLL